MRVLLKNLAGKIFWADEKEVNSYLKKGFTKVSKPKKKQVKSTTSTKTADLTKKTEK